MNEQLDILITAQLNLNSSVKSINDGIRTLSKHPSLQKLNLKVAVDQSFLKSINSFVEATKKLNSAFEIQTSIINKTRISHEANKTSIRQESNEYLAQIKTLQQLQKEINGYSLAKTKANKNKLGEITSFSMTYQNDSNSNDKITVRTDPGGNIKNLTTVNDYLHQKQSLQKKAEDLDRTHYNVLKTNQANAENLDKQHYLALQENLRRDEDFALKQQMILEKIETTRLKYGHIEGVNESLDLAKYDTEKIQKWGTNELDTDKVISYANAFKNVEAQISKTTAGLKPAREESISFGESLKATLGKFPVWLTSVIDPITVMQDMVTTIVDIDSQMTQLKRVMDEDTNFEQMLRGNMETAQEFGRSIKEVNEYAIVFARKGFAENQTQALTKTATLFQNISDLTPSEAMDTMTTAMTAFNIKAEDSIVIADKLNEVNNNFAVTSKDLAESLNNAGSAANASGISMERVIGDTTAIATATRESGTVIGDSLKTIYSRLTSVEESEGVFNAIGISMRAMNGEVKNGEQLLQELAGQWNNLSKEQQQNTAAQLAGSNQATRFIALMQQYDISTKAAETAINSHGSAMRENEVYMTSYGARIQQMKTAWDALSLTVGDQVLGNAIVVVTEVLTGLTNAMRFAVEKFGALPTLFGIVAASVYGLNGAFRAMMLSLKNSVREMLGLAPVAATAAAGFRGLSAALTATKFALKGLMSATIVGAIFAVIGTVLEKVINSFGRANESQDEYISNLQQDISDSNDFIISLENLSNQLKDRNKSQEELNSLYEETGKAIPEIIDHFDSEGKAVYKTQQQIDELIKKEKELNLERSKRLYNKETDNLKASAEAIESSQKKKNKHANDFNYASTRLEAIQFAEQYINDNKIDELDKNSQNYIDLMNKLNQEIIRIFNGKGQYADEFWLGRELASSDGVSDAVNKARSDLNDINDVFGEANEKIQTAREDFANQLKEYNSIVLDETNVTDKNTKIFLDSLGDSFAQAAKINSDNYKDIIYGYEDFARDINSYLTGNNIDLSKPFESGNFDELLSKLEQKFPQYTAYFEAFAKAQAESATPSKQLLPVYDELDNKIGEVSSTAEAAALGISILNEKFEDGVAVGYIGRINSLTSLFKDLSENTKNAKDKIEVLETAETELEGTNRLSTETLQKVIGLFGNRIKITDLTKDGISQLISKIKEETVAQNDAEIIKTNKLIENTQKRINAMYLEMEAIDTLQDTFANLVENGEMSDQQAERILGGKRAIQTDKIKRETDYLNTLQFKVTALKSSNDDIQSYSLNKSDSKANESKKNSTSNKQHLDDTQARINAINKKTVERSELNEAISQRAQELEEEELYAAAIEKTTILLASQKKEVEFLNKANSDLVAERNKLQNGTKYNMSTWLDSNGEQSQAYIKLFNSSSEADQKKLQEWFEKYKLFSDAIATNEEKLTDLNSVLKNTSSHLDDLKLSNTVAYLDKQRSVVDELNYEYDVAEKSQALYTEGTKEYNQQSLIQNGILQKKIAFYKEEVKWVQERLSQGDLTNEQINELNEYLKETNLAMLDAQKSAQSLAESFADDIIDNYKRMIEQRRDLELDAFDERLNAENERHDQYMKNLDEELNKFEEYIDAQLKLMDRQNAADDYEAELNKKLKERQELIDKMNVLSLDNSMEAKAKRADLQQQLDSKNDEIENYKLERERTVRKEGLQDQLEDRQKYNDKLKEDEDKLHQNTVDNIEAEKKKAEQYYKDILEDEKSFYEMKQNLLSQDKTVIDTVLTELKEKYASFFKFLKDQTFATSQEFQNMNNSFQQDENMLENFPGGSAGNSSTGSGSPSGTGGSSGSGNNTNGSGSNKETPQARAAWNAYLANKEQAERIREEMKGIKNKNSAEYKSLENSFNFLKDQNNSLRFQYPFFPDKSHSELVNFNPFTAESGGMTPAFGKEGKFLLAHEKELILNKTDTSNLIKVVDVTRNIIDGMKKWDIGKLFSGNNTSSNTTIDQGVIIENVSIYANDKDTGDSILKKFSSALNKTNKIGLLKS